MFGPAPAAALTRWLRREGFGDLGLRLSRSGRPDLSYAHAYLVPILLLGCGAVLAVLIGHQLGSKSSTDGSSGWASLKS